jgi:hypothetical protein
VCTAAGVEGTLAGLGRAELLSLADLDGDGADEVLFGAVSDVGATYRIARVVGDEFGLVQFAGGPLEVSFGGGADVGTVRTLSCETRPGAPIGAQLEILTLTADAVDGPSMLRTSWVRLDGFEALVVGEVTMDAGPWDTAVAGMAMAGDPGSCRPAELGEP